LPWETQPKWDTSAYTIVVTRNEREEHRMLENASSPVKPLVRVVEDEAFVDGA
jgi:hypothetical protein